MCYHRGHIWCLPTTPATCALHWNKTMFAEPASIPTARRARQEWMNSRRS